VIEFLRSETNPWGEAVAVLLVLGPALLASWGMRRAYRRRRAAEESAYGPLPVVAEPARAPDGEALYTGTTRGGSRAQRVAAYGLFGRGPCRYWFDPAGALVFHRYRGPVVRIATVHTLGLVGAHAGRVLSPERIAIVGWTLGEQDVDSGFAFAEAVQARAFAETLAGVVGLPAERGPYAGA
jgi:hypothetical protein